MNKFWQCSNLIYVLYYFIRVDHLAPVASWDPSCNCLGTKETCWGASSTLRERCWWRLAWIDRYVSLCIYPSALSMFTTQILTSLSLSRAKLCCIFIRNIVLEVNHRFSLPLSHCSSTFPPPPSVFWKVYGECDNFAVLPGHTNAVTDLHFSTDGTSLYTASADKTVMCWDTVTGTRVKKLKGGQILLDFVWYFLLH